jgi:hypothetical protein
MPDLEREMSTLDLHAHTSEGTTHVCSVHRGAGDGTPLQLISAQELARLRQVEADLAALRHVLIFKNKKARRETG